MNLQSFGLTGRKIRPDYVGAINANASYLPRKKALADEEAYRDKTLALETDRLRRETELANKQLENQVEGENKSSVIGLGQLAYETKAGMNRDKKLTAMLDGGGGKGVAGAVTAEPMAGELGDPNPMGVDKVASGTSIGSISEGAGGKGFWSGVKGGLSDWGTVASSSLAGGVVGGDLGAKAFGDNTFSRVAGGAVASGLLGYLASSDPYTAGLSAIFGGSIAGLFG